MSDPNSCQPESTLTGRQLLDAGDFQFDVENFGQVAGKWIIGSAVLAIFGGLLLLQLFRKIPRAMIIIGLLLPVRCCSRTPLHGSLIGA